MLEKCLNEINPLSLLSSLQQKKKQVSLPPIDPIEIPDLLLIPALSCRESSVINYISGWVLYCLLKEDLKRQSMHEYLIDERIDGLHKPVDQFSQMVATLLLFCNEVLKIDGLSTRADAHSILINLLNEHHSALVDSIVRSASPTERSLIFKKVSGVLLADRIRKQKKIIPKIVQKCSLNKL